MLSCFGVKKRRPRKSLRHRISSRPHVELLNGRYMRKGKLGMGVTASVYLAKDTVTGEMVAIKQIIRGLKISEYVEREVLLHRSLSHPNVIGFREVFLTDTHLCIVLEYANGGDLVDYMNKHGNLSEESTKVLFKQLISAVQHCHYRGVVNRDIKLENILLCDSKKRSTVKLADFGFSKLSIDSPCTLLGTLGSAAPELLKYATRQRPYNGEKVDIWTCGVVLFRLIYGRMPFDEETTPKKGKANHARSTRLVLAEQSKFQETCERIQRCDLDFPSQRVFHKHTVDVSVPLLELLSGILTKAKRRWSLRQICECEWLRDVEVEGVEYEDTCAPPREACQQSNSDIRELLLEAKNIPGATQKLPPLAVMPPAGVGVLVRISEVPSELSNPATPEQSSRSFPVQTSTLTQILLEPVRSETP